MLMLQGQVGCTDPAGLRYKAYLAATAQVLICY